MKKFSRKTRVFILITLLLGIEILALEVSRWEWQKTWLLLAISAVACVTQILKVEGATQRSSYNISWMVYGFTFALFGGQATLLVILISHLVEWAWYKYPWYIQSFNLATYILAIKATSLVSGWINPAQSTRSFSSVLGYLAALGIFTFVNHLMVGMVIKLARGETFTQSGVFGILTLAIDFSLLCLGTAAALIWRLNPFATILTVIPLYFIYSTLKVPALRRQTEIDPKTGLYNSAYLTNVLNQELARANRFNSQLTVVMCDLDLLRNINNTYGHLAGDVVLINTAKILQNSVRAYDTVARFGGEEFCILMPETTAEDALLRVEALRAAVEAAEFEVNTCVKTIKATMSFGIASRWNFVQSAEEILHAADLMVYQAKLTGRNRVCLYRGEDNPNLRQIAPGAIGEEKTVPIISPQPVEPPRQP